VARLSAPAATGLARRPAREDLRRFALGAAAVVGIVLLVQLLAQQADASGSPVAAGTLLLGLGLAAAVVFGIARDSSIGVIVWLFAALFTGIYSHAPIERLTFAALVAGWFIAIVTHRRPLRAFGLTELLMLLFVLIEIGSVIAPHQLPASKDLGPTSLITRGALFPFMLFVIARQTMTDKRAVKTFLYFTVFAGAYTALMAIFYKFGPHALVFPREILDPNLGINPERGRGPLLNSAADGVTMVAGLIAAAFLAVQPGIRFKKLIIAALLILPLGIYLTQTRAIWLATGLAVVLGVMFARGFRRWYVIVMGVAVAFIAVNWQSFLSSDRTQGGVTSEGEIESRLNDWATAIWALDEHKLFGWGISRFPDVNTLYHKQWGTIDWNLGFGYLGHNTHLTTGAELGWLGLSVWIAIIVSVTVASTRAWRLLPRRGLMSRGLVFSFWCAWLGYLINAGIVDMRIFTVLNGLFFTWAGIVAGLGDRARDGTLELDDEGADERAPPASEPVPEFSYASGFRT
jgi:O-antigen ligase